MKALTINTYGGSLLLGAHAAGYQIVGSYEDKGFGSAIQAANFPWVELKRTWCEWQPRDLRDVVVIAHPPCSAFSVQNSSWEARGIDSDAFHCTKVVLDYAMENHAKVIAIESVMGALGGAWRVHQDYAARFGYRTYRILQQGAAYGTGQWRDRFWCIWVRGGVGPREMTLTLVPKFSIVRDVIEGYEHGPSPAGLDRQLDRLKERLRKDVPLNETEERYLFGEPGRPDDHWPTGSINNVLWKLYFNDTKKHDVYQRFGSFSSGTLCFINPNGLAPVLLAGSWFYANGRNLSERAYKRIMGFPAEYVFPDGPCRRNMRMYLSKGVIPHVAEWVLDQIAVYLGRAPTSQLSVLNGGGPYYQLTIGPNEIADFRFKKRYWGQECPTLRHYEDQEDEDQLSGRGGLSPEV